MGKMVAILTVVLVGLALSISLWNARAGQPKSDKRAAGQNDDKSVEVRLARAHLELAKLDLRRALEANKRVPGVYSSEFIDKLRLHVAIDEAQLQQYLKGKDTDSHQICIRRAQASVKIAEADLRRRRGVHRRVPTTANALHVNRAEVVAEIAKLNLERTQHLKLENSESVLTHLQWQIDELRHKVLELQMRQ